VERLDGVCRRLRGTREGATRSRGFKKDPGRQFLGYWGEDWGVRESEGELCLLGGNEMFRLLECQRMHGPRRIGAAAQVYTNRDPRAGPNKAGRHCVGTWLSLVEHSLGVRGVGSSNLPVPTIFKINKLRNVDSL
jgi:hypothetical protein